MWRFSRPQWQGGQTVSLQRHHCEVWAGNFHQARIVKCWNILPEIESTTVLRNIYLHSRMLWATVTFICGISDSRRLRGKSHLKIEQVDSLELWSNPYKNLDSWFTDHDSKQVALFEIRKCLTSSVLPICNMNFKKPQTWTSTTASPKQTSNF